MKAAVTVDGRFSVRCSLLQHWAGRRRFYEPEGENGSDPSEERRGVLAEAGKTVCAEMCSNGRHTGTQAGLGSGITCWLQALHYSCSCDRLVPSGSRSLSCPFSRKDV